jgi:hypothetical protein
MFILHFQRHYFLNGTIPWDVYLGRINNIIGCEHCIETISLLCLPQTLFGSSFIARWRTWSTSGCLVEIHWSMLYFHIWMISGYLEVTTTYLEECCLCSGVTTYFDAYLTFGVFDIWHWECHFMLSNTHSTYFEAYFKVEMAFHILSSNLYILEGMSHGPLALFTSHDESLDRVLFFRSF